MHPASWIRFRDILDRDLIPAQLLALRVLLQWLSARPKGPRAGSTAMAVRGAVGMITARRAGWRPAAAGMLC
ncbi:hypothetical protein BJF93_13395 [Xaviernesmea oryzae]|uniref:Uncharacterized protein n=1 Tax=Xaviernesmea oryzae TaxID=464029 RepID=A0A1Q9AR01_9HYPH|nr:hypothetical protein BJF93_13395 [Xaviernesmea oryzae]